MSELSRGTFIDERQGEVVAALGNHEAKALLVVAMNKDTFYSQQELHDLLALLPGAENLDLGFKTNQIGYCQNSLEPIGMVVKADLAEPLSYGPSEDGEETGKPTAITLLCIGYEFMTRLFDTFGGTQSTTALRAPFLRLLIANELLKSPGVPKTKGEIAEAINQDPNSLGLPLRTLSRHGLIEFSTWEPSTDQVSYKIGDRVYRPIYQAAVWTKQALAYLAEHQEATLDELTAHCWSLMSDDEKSDLTPQRLQQKLAISLHAREKSGYVKREGSQEPIAGLNLPQTVFWHRIITSLEKIRRRDPIFLDELEVEGRNFLQDARKIKWALEQAYQASPHAETGEDKSLASLSLKILDMLDEPVSVKEVAQFIEDEFARVVSIWGLRKALNDHVEAGEAEVIKDKVKRYKRAT